MRSLMRSVEVAVSRQRATDKTERVYEAMVRLTGERKGVPPTLRQIAEEVGMRAASNVRIHILRLEEQGRVERFAAGRYAGYRIASGKWEGQ